VKRERADTLLSDERDVDGVTPGAAVQRSDAGSGTPRRRFGPGLEVNAIALMASTAITAVVGLGFWALATNALPAAEVGRASAVITTATMLSQLSGSNIGLLFSRVLPGAGERSRTVVLAGYGTAVAISLVLTGGFLLFFDSSALFASAAEQVVFPLIVITFCLFALQDWVLTGIRVTTWIPVEQLLFAVAKLGLLLWFAAAAFDNAIVLSWVLPCAATVLVINPLLLGRVLPRRGPAPEGAAPIPDRRELGKIFLGEYATGAVTFVIPLVVPLLIITRLGPEANAYYAIPLLIAEAGLGVLIWNISSSYMVEASHDSRRIGHLMSRTWRLSLLVGGVGVPVLYVLAPWLLSFLGEDYAAEGTTAMRLLLLAIPFNIVSLMYINTARVRNQMGRVVALQLLLAVLIIGLTAALLPTMGIDGAGWGYLIAEAVVAVVVAVPLFRFMRAHGVSLVRVPPAPADTGTGTDAPAPGADPGADPEATVRIAAQPSRAGRART
jgi:O-antigen/teichoic acid export membrane protein